MTSRAVASAILLFLLLDGVSPNLVRAQATTPPSVQAPPAAGSHPGLTSIVAADAAAFEPWSRRIDRMIRGGELRLREAVADTLMPGRTDERYAQVHRGVPVFGGELQRQLEGRKTVSVHATLYTDITVDVQPRLKESDASEVFRKLWGTALGPSRPPELFVLPVADGTYRLVYRARLVTADDVVSTFIDAATGETVLSSSVLPRPAR